MREERDADDHEHEHEHHKHHISHKQASSCNHLFDSLLPCQPTSLYAVYYLSSLLSLFAKR
jgi:hypothetical protein